MRLREAGPGPQALATKTYYCAMWFVRAHPTASPPADMFGIYILSTNIINKHLDLLQILAIRAYDHRFKLLTLTDVTAQCGLYTFVLTACGAVIKSENWCQRFGSWAVPA